MVLTLSLSSVSLTCRQILFLTLTTGFCINAMLATVINIAIVAMTDGNYSGPRFSWSAKEKQEVLGVFFVGCACCKLPAGGLTEVFGARKVIGITSFVAGIVTILTPIIVQWNYILFLVSRVILGFLLGFIYPSLPPLTANWYFVTPSSKFLACMEGSAVGIGITYLCGSYLIAAYGWPSIFYALGLLSLIWTVFWFCFIYDYPKEHPRISAKEKLDIQREFVECGGSRSSGKVPWSKILISGPVWADVAAQIASFYLYTTITNELPIFISDVLKVDIKDIGLYSSIPLFGKLFAAIFFGWITDRLQKSDKLPTVVIRRIMQSIGLLIPAVLMIQIAIFGQNIIISMTCIILAKALNAACVGGHHANMIDIAPNFSGTIAGLAYTFSAIAMYLSTLVNGFILENGNSFIQWSYTYWITSVVTIVGYLIFLKFSSGAIQSWNNCSNDHA